MSCRPKTFFSSHFAPRLCFTGCHNLLAYPGSDTRGEVYIYDTVNLVRGAQADAAATPYSSLCLALCRWLTSPSSAFLLTAAGGDDRGASERYNRPGIQQPRRLARDSIGQGAYPFAPSWGAVTSFWTLPSLPFLVLDATHPLLQGTVFRIFATPSGQKLFELRRGFATYATVSSMCFSVRMARGVEAQGRSDFRFSPHPLLPSSTRPA